MAENRRTFIKSMAVVGLTTAGMAVADRVSGMAQGVEAAEKKQKHKESDTVRIGIIGSGSRSQEHFRNIWALPGTQITAICDVEQGAIDMTLRNFDSRGLAKPKVYTGHNRAFDDMLDKEDLDAVIISSPWEWHVPMSVAAMKAGVPYVAVEVSAANTLEECWDLVNVSEQTGSQLMILENVCYRRDVMAVLNMVRQTIFGELLHCRCGYEHDLRDVKFNDGTTYYYKKGGLLKMGAGAYAEAVWRTQHSITRNGDLYPTHGIGPVGNYLNINRGNRFLTLTSMATKSRGLHKFIVDNGGENHDYAKIHFNCGDIVTTMIHCANGETVIVTHDTNSPRPYSLGFRVQGTEGLWYNDGNTIYVEGKSSPHKWDEADEWLKKYDHPMWATLGEKARNAGHGGMDYIMMYDFIDAVKNKKPVPLDCYDAAAWSAVSALSEMSIARGGALVDFPDFTRGQWIKRVPYFAI
jgi:predicted dehydrogenase